MKTGKYPDNLEYLKRQKKHSNSIYNNTGSRLSLGLWNALENSMLFMRRKVVKQRDS